MKKFISLALSTLMITSALASCAPAEDRLDPAITLTSSEVRANADWLQKRLGGEFPTDVVIGLGSDASYGVDMADFEDDGYILRTVGDETLIFGKSADGLDRAIRKYAKAAETGVAEDLDEVYHEGYRVEKLTVAGNDIAEYKIFYPAENNPAMLFAVSEMQNLVQKACGAEISSEQGTPSGKYIEFRFLDDDTFNDGGYKYRVENGNIIIEGTENFGCANAVYRFLQEECGWEGLCFGDSILAENEHVDVKDGAEYIGNPRFEYFYPFTSGFPWKTDATYPNQTQTSYGESIGNLYTGRKFRACHGIQNNKWLPDDRYGAASQPCYTDDYNYLDLYDNIYAYVDSKVKAGQKIGVELYSIDISHPDAMGFCQCKTCLKVLKEENGANAGAVVRFANRLVEDMRKEYDGIKYLIFAYQGTQDPCKTAPDEDVYVTFCTDRICANHALNDGECDYGTFYSAMTNQVLCSWLEGWLDITDNVYVWHYGLDNGLGSNNHSDTLYEDLVYFDEIGVLGVFMEFEYTGFSLNRITNQLGYLVNWDRDMTKEEYMSERERLLEKDYGEGWEYISKCVGYWTEGENRNGCWNCWGYSDQITEQYPPYAAANYDEVYRLAKTAIPLADSEEQEIRCIKFLGLMIYQASCCSYFAAYDAEDDEKLALLEARWSEMIALFEKCGINLDTVAGISSHGLAATCEEEAWTEWLICRDDFTAEGAVMRPMPEKYAAK